MWNVLVFLVFLVFLLFLVSSCGFYGAVFLSSSAKQEVHVIAVKVFHVCLCVWLFVEFLLIKRLYSEWLVKGVGLDC